jgi:VPDSG-CTERM motif
MSNCSPKTWQLLGLLVITAAWANQPAFAGIGTHQFVLTENSQTSLVVTYDNSPLTVINSGPDQWNFLLPAGFLSSTPGTGPQWAEPDNANLVNFVSFGSDITRAALVQSDLLALIGNAAPFSDGTTVVVGTDGAALVFATFHDNAAAAESVPDAGMTFSLFGISLLGLGFLRWKLCA